MVLDLYMTDFCPFAQRTWIALSEKEQDPFNPKLFNYIEVNFYNPSLPLTKEFLKVHNTVPAGKWDGEDVKESLPISYLVDEKFPQNPLQPASEEGKQKMKDFITKYTSGKFDIVGALFPFFVLQPGTEDEKIAEATKELLAKYAELSKDLAASGGPYLLGQQFTIADIAIIPFVDRALVVLGNHKGFKVPEEETFKAFHAWHAAYKARPGYKVTDADRLQRSVDVQPYAKVKRDEYILEVTRSYVNNVRAEVRRQLTNAPPGKDTQDIEAAKAEQRAEREKQAQQAK